MNRALVLQNLASILAGSTVIVLGCAEPTHTDPPGSVIEQSSAAHNFCGNRRCDHGETCSTCPGDCGAGA